MNFSLLINRQFSVRSATELRTPIRAPKTKYRESDLKVLEKLGAGAFGEVYKVLIKSENVYCAMKTLKDTVSQVGERD